MHFIKATSNTAHICPSALRAGCINFNGAQYEVGMKLIGRKVEVLYDATWTDEIELHHKDFKPFKAHKLVIGENCQGSKCALPPFDLAQCQQYIQAHLKYAGCEQEIFTDEAMKAIYDYSAGSARAINKVCMHSLLSAAQRGKKLIDDHLVHLVIETELP